MAPQTRNHGFDSEQTEGSQGATLTLSSLLGVCMLITNVPLNDGLIRQLMPIQDKPDVVPITIACELQSGLDGSPARGGISVRLLASTTPEVALVLASTVLARSMG